LDLIAGLADPLLTGLWYGVAAADHDRIGRGNVGLLLAAPGCDGGWLETGTDADARWQLMPGLIGVCHPLPTLPHEAEEGL